MAFPKAGMGFFLISHELCFLNPFQTREQLFLGIHGMLAVGSFPWRIALGIPLLGISSELPEFLGGDP